MFPFPMQTVWLAIAILFGIIEAATLGLTSIWFALGALGAMVVAMLHGPLWLQILAFVVISAVTLVLTRDIAKQYFNRSRQPTNADRIIDTEALVLEDVDNMHATGTIRVGGAVWTARSRDGEFIPHDSTVRVVDIDGVKAIVVPAKQD